jgi:3-oxoacyl-[acyl-carrier-protein] synthase II
MGWITPLGEDVEDVWHRLTLGATGVRPTPSPVRLRSDLAAMVTSVSQDDPPERRQLALTTGALRAAFADAGVAPDDAGVTLVLGTSYGGHLDAAGVDSLQEWAVAAAAEIGHPHPPLCVTTACSAASDSILVGAELIRAGSARICVCGGADVVTLAKRLGHSALGTMTTDVLRAFDERHAGMVLGEGAAFVVLESAESAAARSATVHALIRGGGSANDAAGLTAPDPTGHSVVLAVRRCLADSGLTERDIAVVSAHATGTPVNDAVEAASLAELFAGQRPGPVVFGTKGALGHSLGACGAIEAISLIMALRHGVAPPVFGLQSPMPGLSMTVPMGRAMPFAGAAGISLTLGFGGFNTALLFSLPTACDDRNGS